MKARAVIGANFGDEGKGLMTDYLVHKHKSDLVIRFNGGAQAGHTVELADGRRHVFGHFGSGAFAGAATLLSKHFIVNPMIFKKERLVLEEKAPVNLDIFIDIFAPVTTPFDMLINQLVEKKRGLARHGSCGMGIGETIERGEQFFDLRVHHLRNTDSLRTLLYTIRDNWVPIRKVQLELGDEFDHIIMNDGLIESYIADVLYLLDHSQLCMSNTILRKAHNPIFEGAQGLLLDQGHEYFPYVTRSNTGIKNVLELMGPDFDILDVTYMTRAYLTRHGAGPLRRELQKKPFSLIEDKTNIPNDWQGNLRFAYLDIDLLKNTIVKDLMNNKLNYKVRPTIGITCLDQCGDVAPVIFNGAEDYLHKTQVRDVGDQIAKHLNLSDNHYKSFGPTRETMVDFMAAGDELIELRSKLENYSN